MRVTNERRGDAPRRAWVLCVCALALSLVLTAALRLRLPETPPVLGYAVMGSLAFSLGVCATLLARRLRSAGGKDRDEE